MDFLQMESPFMGSVAAAAIACDRFESSKPRGLAIVFIVDGDSEARESLATLMTLEGWHTETFASGEEFLAHPVNPAPGCLILDVSLPGMGGLELQGHAAMKCPHLPTIFLSAKGDIPTTVKAMKAGAHEFLSKPSRDQELLSTVREALERSRLALARRAQKQALQECYASLTVRQRQVMTLVCAGRMNKQVAAELGVSEITVKAHRGQVMQKMQANSLADLVKKAGRLGIAKAAMLRESGEPISEPGVALKVSYAIVA